MGCVGDIPHAQRTRKAHHRTLRACIDHCTRHGQSIGERGQCRLDLTHPPAGRGIRWLLVAADELKLVVDEELAQEPPPGATIDIT